MNSESRRLWQVMIKQKAELTYATFTQQERSIVRFGMLPYAKTSKAADDLIIEHIKAEGRPPNLADLHRDLAVAIMDVANAGPDKMIA